MIKIIYLITGVLLLILFFIDREKTKKSIKVGIKKLIKNIPMFLNLIIFVALLLSVLNDEFILKYLGGKTGILGVITGSAIGSITIMPGFVAFPLAAVLLEKGVSYMVLASFTNTLMMVGIVTFPMEKSYLGAKVSIIRNVTGYIISLIVALVIGLVYGELI